MRTLISENTESSFNGAMTLSTTSNGAPRGQSALANVRRYAAHDGIDAILKKERLDALIGTTSIPGWYSDPARRPRPDGSFTSTAAAALVGFGQVKAELTH